MLARGCAFALAAFVALMVLQVPTEVTCMQLLRDPGDPMRANGNGTLFDISKVLNYP